MFILHKDNHKLNADYQSELLCATPPGRLRPKWWYKKQISTLCSETDRVVRIRLLKSWGKMKDIQLLYLENPAAFKKKKNGL